MTTWKIKEFNEYIKNPSMDVRHVIKLDLSHNYLTSLHESIGNLTNLIELYLGHNRITILPESICKLY